MRGAAPARAQPCSRAAQRRRSVAVCPVHLAPTASPVRPQLQDLAAGRSMTVPFLCSTAPDHSFVPTCPPPERRAQPLSRMPALAGTASGGAKRPGQRRARRYPRPGGTTLPPTPAGLQPRDSVLTNGRRSYAYAFFATGTGMPAILRLTEPRCTRLVKNSVLQSSPPKPRLVVAGCP